jgi:hypothetical protein
MTTDRDQFIGQLLVIAARQAALLHDEMGLPPTVRIVFDASGVFTEDADGVRTSLPQALALIEGETA